jgi:hypothetical protein
MWTAHHMVVGIQNGSAIGPRESKGQNNEDLVSNNSPNMLLAVPKWLSVPSVLISCELLILSHGGNKHRTVLQRAGVVGLACPFGAHCAASPSLRRCSSAKLGP